jgi:hypothetical protein
MGYRAIQITEISAHYQIMPENEKGNVPDKIGIIVEESAIAKKGAWRENFWNDMKDRFNEFGKKITNFDIIGPDELKDIQDYNIIIIKWDAANGHKVFGSNDILDQLENLRPSLKDFIKKGGILIVVPI